MRMIAFTIYSFAILSFAMADPLPQGLTVLTEDTIIYDSNNFKELAFDKAIIFTVDAKHDAHIGFFSEKKSCASGCSNEMYEIVIGGWNDSQSVIRRGSQGSNKDLKATPNILKSHEDSPFWADAKDGLVRLGYGKVIGSNIVMKWQDNQPLDPSYVGFMTGFGSTGIWKISENSKAQCPTDHPFAYLNGGYCCKTRKERPVKLGITPQNQIDDGTCDGLDFNRQSVCCRDEAYTPCSHASGCFDNSDGTMAKLQIKTLCGPKYTGTSDDLSFTFCNFGKCCSTGGLELTNGRQDSIGDPVDCSTPDLFGSREIGDCEDFEFKSGSMITGNVTLSNIDGFRGEWVKVRSSDGSFLHCTIDGWIDGDNKYPKYRDFTCTSLMAFDSILVSTGRPTNSSTKTEIINLDQEGVTCKDLEEYPWQIYGALGFNMGSLPVICGGRDESGPIVNQCHRLESGKWQPFANLTQGRYGAAGISHAQSFIFFGGNEIDGSGKWVKLNSTEILTEQGVSAGPEMPEAVNSLAIAVVNETTFILTGGYTDWAGGLGGTSAKTLFFNHVSQQFQTGTPLITGRYDHTSATIQDKVTMEDIVAVLGGFNGNTGAYLDSTELLFNGESEWQQGPQMPKKLRYHSTVEIGRDLYTIGGYSIDGSKWQTAIYRMSCSSRVCTWTTMPQELKVARQSSVAITIPRSLCVPI